MLAFAALITLASRALSYGSSGAAVNNGLFGIFVILLAVFILRAPASTAPLCFLTGLAGLWLAASPFVLDYFRYVLSTAVNLWVGLAIVLLSAFIYGEINRLHQPLDATD